MEIKEISSACEKISIKGLTREIICDLLEIYNKNKVPESHSKCYAGSGIRVDATSLKRIVASFGLGFTNDEVTRAIISFSRGDALTFSDFLKFYLWYIPVYQKIRNKTKAVLEKSSDVSLESDIEKLVKNSKLVDENIIGFILEDFKLFYKNASKPKSSKLVEKMMDDLNQLPYKYNFSRKDNIRPYIRFDITLMNIFGLIPYEYIGIESDLPSLDVFIQVELCNQTFKSSVFPARYSPSISQTFSFEFNSPSEMSFLDASWWIQNAKLKISVYAVHYLDISVAFHLLGSANQPLLPLLIDQHGRTTCTINLQALTPIYPIPILVSITNICKENEENDKLKKKVKIKKENDQKVVNPLIYHSAPIEQLIFEKFLRQIRDNLINSNGLSKQNFIGYCNYFKEISVRFPAREYQLLGFDEMNVAHFINTYLYKDGILLKTTARKNEKIKNKVEQLIYIVSLLGSTVFDRPEPEVMQIRNLITTKTCKLDPNIMERALLLCNLFKAYGIKSYVCIGDHQFQRYVWVMTPSNELDTDNLPDFMMFDCGNKAYTISSFINHKYEFPTTSAIDRIDGQQQIIFSHGINPLLLGINSISSVTEEDQYFEKKKDYTRNLQSKMRHWSVSGIWPDRVPCGLKVATVFDSERIYCNIQENDDIEVVDWDLNNSTFWAPFYKENNLRNKNVYDKRFYERMLKKPEFVFTDEEKTNMDKLLFQKKFNMFKKNCIKKSFDKYTRDTFQFNIDFEDMFSFRKVYQDQNFFENYYKSHLNSLLETQLLLNLTPIERQILNTFLICKDKHQNVDEEIELDDDNDDFYLQKFGNDKETQELFKSMTKDQRNTFIAYSKSENKDEMLENFFSTKKEEKKQIDIKQKRFKILLKSQKDEERTKINSIIRHINLSMMKLNSNGHAKFIEAESITRFLYAFEIIKANFEKLNESYLNNFQIYSISDIDFYEKLKNKDLLSEKDIETCNKYLFNFQLDYLHLINSYDKYNDEEFRPISDIFNNSLNNVKNRIEELTRKISKNFDKDDFYILMKKMIEVDPEFLIYSEIIQKNGNVEKELSNYISSKVSKSEYLILEIFLQRCESLANQSDEFDQDEIETEKEEEDIKEIVPIDFNDLGKSTITKIRSIFMFQKKQLEILINSPNKYFETSLYIPDSVIKRELLSIMREEKDSIYRFYSVTEFFNKKFPSWNKENSSFFENRLENELKKMKENDENAQIEEQKLKDIIAIEDEYKEKQVMNEKLEILSLVEMVLEIFYEAMKCDDMVFISRKQKELYENKKDFNNFLDNCIDEIFVPIVFDDNSFHSVCYQSICLSDDKITFFQADSTEEIYINDYAQNSNNNDSEASIDEIIKKGPNLDEIFVNIKNSIKFIIDDYRSIFANNDVLLLKQYENRINYIFYNKEHPKIYGYIKYKISLYIKKALVAIKKIPRYGLPYPDDWFVRCDKPTIFLIAKKIVNKMKNSMELIQPESLFKVIESEIVNLNRNQYFDDKNCKIQFLAQMLTQVGRIIDYSSKKMNYYNYYSGFPEAVDIIFNSLISSKELVEFQIFRQNIGVFKALQNVLDKVIKLNYESDDILDQLYYIIGQKVPDIEQSIEEFNKDFLEKLVEQYKDFIDNDKLNSKKKLIKKRIESFRLTKRLIKECTNVDNKSTSYKIPKEIIAKPPELVESYPNSMSNFFMTCRLIIDHIMNKPFYFLFFNNKSIKKKQQQQQQQPTQLTILQQKEEIIKEIQEQEQIRTKTLDSMLDLRNKMMIQKENRVKRYEQRKNYHEDITSYINVLKDKYKYYFNQLQNKKNKFEIRKVVAAIENDVEYLKLKRLLNDQNLPKDLSDELEHLNEDFEILINATPSSISTLNISQPTSVSGHRKTVGPKPSKSSFEQPNSRPFSKRTQSNASVNLLKHFDGPQLTVPKDLKDTDFKYLTNSKKKKELLKKRWKSRQKVRDIIKSIHLFDEKVVPYVSFDTKKDRYIDYINMVKTEPGIEFNENQKKELNNLLHLDVAMSTSSSLLIFHKKWSEERLIKKIQKTLLSFEKDIISKGRYDMNKLRTIVNKSIRSHRYMLRVSRHKIDEPNNLADQLSLSGALTSSCGAEKCIIVAQPFRYILDARSTWIVLLFIYKVPDNLTFSKKETV